MSVTASVAVDMPISITELRTYARAHVCTCVLCMRVLVALGLVFRFNVFRTHDFGHSLGCGFDRACDCDSSASGTSLSQTFRMTVFVAVG